MEENTIFIGNKPVMNYVLAVVTQFNDNDTVTLRARGKAISRAVDTAEIVRNSFVQEADIADIQISTLKTTIMKKLMFLLLKLN